MKDLLNYSAQGLTSRYMHITHRELQVGNSMMNVRPVCMTNVCLPHSQIHPAIITVKLRQDNFQTLPDQPDDYRKGNHCCAESRKPVCKKIKCLVNIMLSSFYGFHDVPPFVFVNFLQSENRATGSPPRFMT